MLRTADKRVAVKGYSEIESMSLKNQILDLQYKKIVWMLPIAFMLHELEEWNIHLWYTNFENPPPSCSRLRLSYDYNMRHISRFYCDGDCIFD